MLLLLLTNYRYLIFNKKQGRQSAQNTAIENTKTQTMKANNLLNEVQ